jgi:uncharacterized membrane protein YbhN (UPF0104 family)
VFGLVVLAAGVAALAVTHLGHGSVTDALRVLEGANRSWLLLGGAGFVGALVCSAAAWRSGLRACGGRATLVEITSRYAIGSLVNSAAPAHVGGALRVGLLARTLAGADPLLRACGVGTVVAVARTFGLAVLVFAAAVAGRAPLWPVPVLLLGVGVALVACTRLSARVAGRVAAVLQAFRSPRAAFDIFAWIACSWTLRLGATVAVIAAFGIAHALSVAVVLLAAIALAGLLPLTPGNIGAGAGAAALALHGSGLGAGTALALGMAFQALETCTSVALGLGGVAVVSAPGTRMRRWSVVLAGAAAVAIATTVGFASVDLV